MASTELIRATNSYYNAIDLKLMMYTIIARILRLGYGLPLYTLWL